MTVSMSTLPTDFTVKVSEGMLRTPEPAYTYARMLFMAVAQAELKKGALGGTFGLTPDRAASSQGASVPDLSDTQLMISDQIRSEALMVNLELQGTGTKGNKVTIARPVFSGAGYTQAARRANPAIDISTVPIDLTSEAASITLELAAGPYDSANSRVAPYAIDALASERSMHSLPELVGLHMSRDRMKYVDSILATLFSAGTTTIYPNDPNNAVASVDAAFAAVGDRPMDVETLYRAEEALTALGIPRFANGKYMAVLSTRQVRQLRSDPEFRAGTPFDPSRNPLSESYVKTIGGVEIYVSATNLSTTNSSTITYQKGTMFGPGAVGYAPGRAVEVRFASADNYGLSPRVIWAGFEGFEKLDQRFIAGIYTD